MQMHAMHVAVNTNCYMIKLHNIMMKASDGNIFRVTGPLCGEFTGEFPAQRLVTRSFDVFFDLRLNKQFSKQSWGWWVETLSQSLWRHSNDEGAICAPIRNKISYLLCIQHRGIDVNEAPNYCTWYSESFKGAMQIIWKLSLAFNHYFYPSLLYAISTLDIISSTQLILNRRDRSRA